MSEELQTLPLEEQISQELVKQNVTQAVIASLKERYLPLKISGIEDKETYLLVKEGRKECKSIRVMASKICKKGREDAVAIQKAWVAKEKEVTDQIGEVEDYLEAQEKDYETAVTKEKEEKKRRHEEQLIMRQQALTSMGALYSDGSFALGDVSFELGVIKECEPEIWESSILPKFKEQHEIIEKERTEQKRLHEEKEAELKRQQEDLDRRQREMEEKEAALKKAKEEQLQKEKEELARKEAEAEAQIKALISSRCNELQSLGLTSEFPSMDYVFKDVRITLEWVRTADKIEWNETIGEITPDINRIKAEEEQKRLAEMEAQKEAERIKTLGVSRLEMIKKYIPNTKVIAEEVGAWPSEEWVITIGNIQEEYEVEQKKKWEAEQEEKRKQDELKKQLELEQAKDKEKWEEIIRRVNEIEVYEMRSSQYRKKAMMLREKLQEIKSL